MKFWIVKYGETVPFGPKRSGGQLFRAGSIARTLAKRGHDVIWWTGRFEHQTKSYIASEGTTAIKDPESPLAVRLIDSPGYKSNVSLARAIDHRIFRNRLKKEMRDAPKPDLIFASFPIPEVAADCVRFGKEFGIPVVTDVRDLWPDVIVGRLKDKFGFFPTTLTKIYRRKVSKIFKNSDALYATSEGYLKWAQLLGKRSLSSQSNDNFFLLSSETPPTTESFLTDQKTAWLARGLDFSRIVFCWIGSLSSQKSHVNMLDAFEKLPQDVANRVQLVICGRGDLEGRIKLLAEKHRHFVFSGFMPIEDVKGLCLNSDVGMFCYDDVESFRLNYTNKFGEYMGCGLPVLTTVSGPLISDFAADAVIPTGGSGVDDIMRTIIQVSESPPGHKVKEIARNIHQRYFNAPQTYSKICDSLENLVAEQDWQGKT